MVASFVGRPPFINHRYCTLTPPLDLSDEILVIGGDVLAQAISELDSNGWNTAGVRNRITHTRMRFLLAVTREQALDLALGTLEPHDMIRNSQ